VLNAPLLALVAAIIKVATPGPALFSQVRVGRGEVTFRLHKFRTMVLDADKLGSSVTSGHDPRITPFGKLLRKTKFDEVPQLWNVVKGDMSLVGPRPEVPEIVALYTVKMRQILNFRPGITSVSSLELHREEELLNLAANPDDAYARIFVPMKVASAMRVAQNPSFVHDVQILVSTAWVLSLGRMFTHHDNELDSFIRHALEDYGRDRPDIHGKQLLDSWRELPDSIRHQIL
jgi:lipopolysaccharide/colanic/teichoic acid biosynthesis glycosyltransferase